MRDCPRKKYADERKKRETPRLGDSLTNDPTKKESVNRHEQQKPIIERKEDYYNLFSTDIIEEQNTNQND